MYLVGQVDGGGEAILCMNFETLDLDIPGPVSDQDVGLNFLFFLFTCGMNILPMSL